MRRPTCVQNFDARFGRLLIKYLGGDPSPIKNYWCWREFAQTFPHLRKRAEKYFETAKTGDPALAAYHMACDGGSSREWAEGVIERARVGDPEWAAYHMARDGGSSREWAEQVIERASVGYSALAAYRMVLYCGSSREWYEKIKREHAE